MIGVKEAVAKAVEFAETVLEPGRASQILLEEVEAVTENGKDVWVITLSMIRPSLVNVLRGDREYKAFTVDRQTGEVLAMKIRALTPES